MPTPPLPATGPAAPRAGARRPVRRRRVALMALVAVLAAACGGGDGPGSAAPVPLVGAQTVTGVPGLVLWDLSPSGTQVFVAGSTQDAPVPSDQAAVSAYGDAVAAWLDTVLTERNAGATTTFAASTLDASAFATSFEVPAGTVPDRQVTAATYLIEIAYLGTPAWASVRVETTWVSLADQAAPPTTRVDTFVFGVDAGGAPQLIGFEAP